MSEPKLRGHVFDRAADFGVHTGVRPHWSQAATITFITLRLRDSIPSEIVTRWDRERMAFLQRCGISDVKDWREGRERLGPDDRTRFEKQFRRARETCLDECRGACELGDPQNARIVADCLRHFDGERYLLGDFVVMPNHVHLLAVFPSQETLPRQCTSWMRYSARSINERIGRRGRLWQPEPFDHLVRSETQLNYVRDYIRDNPLKARLRKGQYLHCPSGGAF
ncbi:MAG: transposase [Planctomycetota bacterium]